MGRTYKVISSDSHLEVPVTRWIDRMPKQWRDRAPRFMRLPDGSDAHIVEGRPILINGLNLCGRPYEEYSPIGVNYENTPGTGPPEQRVREQDQDGVDAEVLFAGVGGPDFWRGINNDEVYLSFIHAYNEFLGEEYCAAAPDRLLGMGIIPEMGVDAALKELEHCVKLGLKGVTLNAFPSGLGYPVPEDDRFWAAATEMPIAITVHIGFGFPAKNGGPTFKYAKNPGEVGLAGQDVVRRFAIFGQRGALPIVQLVFAGVFDRFPNLKIFWAESQVGWIPQFLESLDDTYERNRHWAERLLGLTTLKRMPSEYVLENNLWGFWLNPVGVKLRHDIGVDRIMWLSDFPHSVSDWPHSQQVLEQNFAGVPEDEKYKMVAGNAIKFFRLDAN